MLVTPSAANVWINLSTLSSITGSLVVTNTVGLLVGVFLLEFTSTGLNNLEPVQPLEHYIVFGKNTNSKIERDRMATNTIADIHPVGDSWLELFTSTGITSGTNAVILNKGSVGLLVAVNTSGTPPVATSMDGWCVPPGNAIKVTAENYIFLKALGPCSDIHVEVA